MKSFTPNSKVLIALFLSIITRFTVLAQPTIGLADGFPVSTAFNGIAYGNGMYIAVGGAGYIAKSTDGTNWSIVKRHTFLDVTYTRITFGNSLFVATTSNGKIVTSSNGTDWTERSSGVSTYLNDVIYAASKFMIVGNSNTLLTSTDGINWSSVSTGAGASDILMTICYANSKFSIGVRTSTSESRVLNSATGNAGTWSNVYIANSVNSLNKLLYLGNRYWAFTSSTNIWSSTDAVTWSQVSNSRLTTPNQVFHGYHDGTKYYFVGNSNEHGYLSVFTSTDGNTFTLQPQSLSLVSQYSAYLNGKHFVLGNEGLVSSNDGIIWKYPGANFNSIAYSGSRYVAVGNTSSNEGAIYTTTDWTTWTDVSITGVRQLMSVAHGNGKWVAVGNLSAGGNAQVATSPDGTTWTAGNSGNTDPLRSVVYGDGKWVAVGNNGRILLSTNDGASWTSVDNGAGYTLCGVSYIGGRFIAVGGGTALNSFTKVKISSNGTTWTDVSPSPSISGHFHAIAYGNGKYVLTGRDNTSGSQKFIAVTTTDITVNNGYSATSGVTTPEGDVGTSLFGSVAFANYTFVSTSNIKVTPFSAYVLTSTDGVNWTSYSAGTVGRMRNAIAAGSMVRSVGTMSTRMSIATSSMPLKLLEFTGRANGTGASLNWITSDEKEVDRFEIQRSEDGKEFKTVGQVPAKNAVAGDNYRFNDVVSLTTVKYYRLKMIDIDGKFTQSRVIRLQDTDADAKVSVYPNPASDYFIVSLKNNSPSKVTVFNAKGEKMISQQSSNFITAIDISQLNPGAYIVRVEQNGNVYTQKMVKRL